MGLYTGGKENHKGIFGINFAKLFKLLSNNRSTEPSLFNNGSTEPYNLTTYFVDTYNITIYTHHIKVGMTLL